MNFLITEIVGPTARRVGSMAGGALVGLGVSSEQVAVIEAGIAAAILVVADLAWSRRSRWKLIANLAKR